MLKAAFITHDISNDIQKLVSRGSAQSLKYLLKNLKDVDVTLVGPGRTQINPILAEAIRNWFGGGNISQVVCLNLPVADIYEGRPKALRHWAIGRLRTFRWRLRKQRLLQFLDENNFDFVHLNSITLSHLLGTIPFPTILHIREMLGSGFSQWASRFQQADGLICIDNATRDRLSSQPLPLTTIMANPVDMRGVADTGRPEALSQAYGVKNDRIILAIIGRLSPVKGVEPIIRALRQSTNPNLELLVVGRCLGDRYGQLCYELAAHDSRIHFVGVEHQIDKIYRIADYIVRGDPDFRVGRTLLEGLYAGCHVISPGSLAELKRHESLISWRNKFSWYAAGNMTNLVDIFNSLSAKVTNKIYTSNVDDYSHRFTSFVKQVISLRKASSIR